jgi:16S rRNA (cytosine1402-N4)-methyltransferase
MLGQVLEALMPGDGDVFVDCTFGAGGYARGLLECCACHVVGIDRDPDALAQGGPLVREFPGRLTLLEGRFSQMVELVQGLGSEAVDGVVLDLGVSSMQLDRPERGFSFAKDGPLDMRMDQGRDGSTPSAAEIVNGADEAELAEILWRLGEERQSRRIARAIARARANAPIETTAQLASLVEQVSRGGRGKIHPATRTFQALRIYVNRELDELERGLSAAERILEPGGRLAVVSFHSLEDRIVKGFFKARSGAVQRPSRHMPEAPETGPAPSFRLQKRGAAGAGGREVGVNPRARSAKLRAGVRTDAPALPFDAGRSAAPRIGSA